MSTQTTSQPNAPIMKQPVKMMAISHHVPAKTFQLSGDNTPGFTHAADLTKKSASRAEKLLTYNHTQFHSRFNGGFHNHIAHHILALWALGATPEEMEDMWEYNKTYQAPLEEPNQASTSLDLTDPAVFDECLGKNDCYKDFLKHFKSEIAQKGGPAVIKEYVLKGDDRANDIFCRMYTDLVHPMIHLGYAIEFNQPSLVAEALSAACIHDNWPKKFLLPTEDHVKSNRDTPSKPLLQILNGMRNDPVIASGVRDTDPFNKIRDGLLSRVGAKELVPHLSQFQVKPTPEDLQRQMEDMMYTCAYSMAAAQRPGKREKLDFVLVHNATLSVFYPAIMSQDWLSDHDKARLLEAKARVDAVMYAACASPQLYPERIVDYKPRHPEDGWKELFHRSRVYRDEGHITKLIRALYALEPLGDLRTDFPINKSDFVKIAHLAVDSCERAFEADGSKLPEEVKKTMAETVGQGGEMVVGNQMRFVFYGGLPKAWQWIPDLEEPQNAQADDSPPAAHPVALPEALPVTPTEVAAPKPNRMKVLLRRVVNIQHLARSKRSHALSPA